MARLRAMGENYVRFGMQNPGLHRLMFMMERPMQALPEDLGWESGISLHGLLTSRDELPAGIVYYNFQQFKQEDQAEVHQIALTSPATPYRELELIAEAIEDRVESVAGVKEVKIEAFPERQVRVSLDFQRCVAMNIPPASVLCILQRNNANVPGGDLDAGSRNFSIKRAEATRTWTSCAVR